LQCHEVYSTVLFCNPDADQQHCRHFYFLFLRSIFLENNKVTQITFLNVTRYLQKVIDYVTNYFRAKSN
jgi:hypothetical protein